MFSSNIKTIISVELQRLDVESQARLDWLLDQNNERRLTLAEHEELQRHVAQYEHLLTVMRFLSEQSGYALNVPGSTRCQVR